MIDLERFWAEVLEERPGVTEEELQQWEYQYGVLLPEILRMALRRQNGGQLRYAEIQIHPLSQILPVGDDFWEYASFDEGEFANRLAFFFALNPYGGGYLLLQR